MKPIKAKTHQEVLKILFRDKASRKRYEEGLEKLRIVHSLIVLREKHDLTQSELAKKIGVSQPFIAKLESGEAHNFSLETLIKIASALNSEIEIRFRPKISKAA